MKRYDLEPEEQDDGWGHKYPGLYQEECPYGEWIKAEEALLIETECNRLKTENMDLLGEIEEWKCASSIMCGDDTREITPKDAIKYWEGIETERDQLRLSVAEYELQAQHAVKDFEKMRERIVELQTEIQQLHTEMKRLLTKNRHLNRRVNDLKVSLSSSYDDGYQDGLSRSYNTKQENSQ